MSEVFTKLPENKEDWLAAIYGNLVYEKWLRAHTDKLEHCPCWVFERSDGTVVLDGENEKRFLWASDGFQFGVLVEK